MGDTRSEGQRGDEERVGGIDEQASDKEYQHDICPMEQSWSYLRWRLVCHRAGHLIPYLERQQITLHAPTLYGLPSHLLQARQGPKWNTRT